MPQAVNMHETGLPFQLFVNASHVKCRGEVVAEECRTGADPDNEQAARTTVHHSQPTAAENMRCTVTNPLMQQQSWSLDSEQAQVNRMFLDPACS